MPCERAPILIGTPCVFARNADSESVMLAANINAAMPTAATMPLPEAHASPKMKCDHPKWHQRCYHPDIAKWLPRQRNYYRRQRSDEKPEPIAHANDMSIAHAENLKRQERRHEKCHAIASCIAGENVTTSKSCTDGERHRISSHVREATSETSRHKSDRSSQATIPGATQVIVSATFRVTRSSRPLT